MEEIAQLVLHLEYWHILFYSILSFDVHHLDKIQNNLIVGGIMDGMSVIM